VLADACDPRHDEVVALRRKHTANGILVTTDYVLDEAFTRLFGGSPFDEAERFCSAVLRARDSGMVLVEPITAERFTRAYRLRLRYRDKPRISFTDLTSFVVMAELGIRDVLTADAHFAVALGAPTGGSGDPPQAWTPAPRAAHRSRRARA
jgi:predicted nucleic acid-binding protein